MADCDVAIIGAGPYGLSAAAFLREIPGLECRVFGEPFGFWRNCMPKGMILRSAWSASSIADPLDRHSLDSYKIVSGNHLGAPIPLQRFIAYGLWFQHSLVPEVDCRKVTCVDRESAGFRLKLEDGSSLSASRVVVATGLAAFPSRPPQFHDLPSVLVSHTSEHQDLSSFSGKRVAVIGGGQSAAESAALLYEAGVEVELIVRGPQIHWLGWKERLQCLGPFARALYSEHDVGPAGISRLVAAPALLQKLPQSAQHFLRTFSIRPAAATWLAERLRNVVTTTHTSITAAVPVSGRLRLGLSDGSERFVDHVLLGTGYRVDAARYSFLTPEISRALHLVNGFPKLDRHFQSSVPGLQFLGAPAAGTFGPLMYFVSGTKYASTNLCRFMMRRPHRFRT
jgi:cation diffusion facilitator CzcD-associated flavoprotein CzcO